MVQREGPQTTIVQMLPQTRDLNLRSTLGNAMGFGDNTSNVASQVNHPTFHAETVGTVVLFTVLLTFGGLVAAIAIVELGARPVPISTAQATDATKSAPLFQSDNRGTMVYRGFWKQDTMYYANDIVLFNSTMYMATRGNMNYPPDGTNDLWSDPLSTLSSEAYLKLIEQNSKLENAANTKGPNGTPITPARGAQGTQGLEGTDNVLHKKYSEPSPDWGVRISNTGVLSIHAGVGIEVHSTKQ